MEFTLIVAGVAVVISVLGVLVFRKGPARQPVTRRGAAAPARASRRVDIDTGVAPHNAAQPVAADDEAAEMPAALQGFTLLGEAELAPERREELLATIRKITLPPRSLKEIMSPEFLASGATRELADFILREPLLAAKVLGGVNSPFYGLQSPIVSVPHAITFLGMNAVRSMAIKFTLEQTFTSDDPELKRLYANIWDAGMIGSELCVLLSQKLGFTDTGASSTQTVLSFLGDFAVLSLLDSGAARTNWPQGLLERTRVEQESLGLNSTIISSLLMREWGLPSSIVDGASDIARVLVTPAQAADPARRGRTALCYACARIGESIALGRISDSSQIDLAGQDAPEYFHLKGYLRLPELARLAEHLQSPDVRIAVSRMIAASALGKAAA